MKIFEKDQNGELVEVDRATVDPSRRYTQTMIAVHVLFTPEEEFERDQEEAEQENARLDAEEKRRLNAQKLVDIEGRLGALGISIDDLKGALAPTPGGKA